MSLLVIGFCGMWMYTFAWWMCSFSWCLFPGTKNWKIRKGYKSCNQHKRPFCSGRFIYIEKYMHVLKNTERHMEGIMLYCNLMCFCHVMNDQNV